MYFKFINGFCLGIVHEGYPEYDAWMVSIFIGFILISFGRNVEFYEEEE